MGQFFMHLAAKQSKRLKKNWQARRNCQKAEQKNIKQIFFSYFGGVKKFIIIWYSRRLMLPTHVNRIWAHIMPQQNENTHTGRQFACYKALHILRRTAAATTQNINKNRNKKCIWQFLPCIFHNSQLSRQKKKNKTKILHKITNIFADTNMMLLMFFL